MFSSNPVPSALNADRAPQLKARVMRLPLSQKTSYYSSVKVKEVLRLLRKTAGIWQGPKAAIVNSRIPTSLVPLQCQVSRIDVPEEPE